MTAVFVLGMIAAASWDVAQRRVPNWLNGALLIAGLCGAWIVGGASAMLLGLSGAAVGLFMLLLPFHARWIGGGDVKLAAAAGIWLGPIGAAFMVVVGIAFGGILSMVIAVLGGKAMRAEVVSNLKIAVQSASLPVAPVRARAQQNPLAVALALAAIAVFISRGGLNALLA
jgi:prepilin peptidase CpaA